jgi:hypothetical protein
MHLLRRETPGPNTHMSRYLHDIETLYGLKSGQELPESLLEQVRKAHSEYRNKEKRP